MVKRKKVKDFGHTMDVTCPWCLRHADRALSPVKPDAMPKAGDLVMCHGCGRFSLVDEFVERGGHGKLAMRPLTREEARELAGNYDAYCMWQHWMDTVGKHRKWDKTDEFTSGTIH